MATMQMYTQLHEEVMKLVERTDQLPTANEQALVRINAQLDLAFTKCQALLDEVDRFQQPLLYFRLLATYRTLFSLFQRVG